MVPFITFSISASFKTIIGSEPPSSKTEGFTFLPAILATSAPAASEPVKDTPTIFGLLIIESVSFPDINKFLYKPFGAPAAVNISSKAIPHCGILEAVFKTTVLPAIM